MNAVAYMAEHFKRRKVMVSPSSVSALGEVDSVVFDCDGVLIDARRSYDAAILRTAAAMVEGFAGVKLPLQRTGGKLILDIRRTGGFNDDWETTYAITVFSLLALSVGTVGAMQRLRDTVKEFSAQDRLRGRASVDEYLEEEGLESSVTAKLREYVDYQVDPVHTRMTRQFDEMYYGGTLFRRIFGSKAVSWQERGLIEHERLLVSASDLRRLKKILGGTRIAMSTGRPFVAVEYTLGSLLGYFDREASMFIGDGDIDPELAPRLKEFRKPSGKSLVRAYGKLSSQMMLYTGDSAEDRLMVKDASRTCRGILFAGIYGTSFDEGEQMEYFAKTQSDLIMKDASSIPWILEAVRA